MSGRVRLLHLDALLAFRQGARYDRRDGQAEYQGYPHHVSRV